MKTLIIHNLDNHPTKPYQEFVDLQGDFKTYVEIKKLADRIAEVGFKYDFYTWECPEEVEHNGVTYPVGTCFIVDAHARQRALQFLERDGYKIPPVPYTRIQANSLEEAKLEILYLNSRYGEIQTTSEFLTDLQSQLPEVMFDGLIIPELEILSFTVPDKPDQQTQQSIDYTKVSPSQDRQMQPTPLEKWEEDDDEEMSSERGRIILVYQTQEERNWLSTKLETSFEKIIYTVSEIRGF